MIRFIPLMINLLFLVNVHAQDVVEEKLIGIAQHMETTDFVQAGDFAYLDMANQEEVEFEVELNQSERYNFWGVCDDNCVDIDFTLIDVDGYAIETDDLLDAMPLVAPNAPPTGTYKLRITMYNCEADSCRVGFGRFVAPAVSEYVNPSLNLRGSTAQELVDNQLSDIASAMQEEGWNSFQERTYLSLPSGQEERIPITLPANTSITFWGVCDGNCGDMDFVLLNADGNSIAEDVLIDAQPRISISTEESANYSLIARMYQCDIEPCKVGISYWSQ